MPTKYSTLAQPHKITANYFTLLQNRINDKKDETKIMCMSLKKKYVTVKKKNVT